MLANEDHFILLFDQLAILSSKIMTILIISYFLTTISLIKFCHIYVFIKADI